MRVLQLIHRYPPAIGGSEVWCREVSRQLAACGHRVEVMTLDVLEEDELGRERPGAGRRGVRVERDGPVEVRRFPLSFPASIVRRALSHRLVERFAGMHLAGPHSLTLYAALRRAISGCDMVHLHTLPYPHNLAGMLAARALGRPVALTPYFHAGHRLYEAPTSRWLLRRADVVFALSEHEREKLRARGVDGGRIVVAGAGVHAQDYARESRPAGELDRLRADLSRRQGLSPATELVLFLGRKEEPKGIPVLAAAVAEVARRRDVALLLAGPDTRWFRDFHSSLPAAARRRTIDLGTLSQGEKIGLLHASRLLVLPSATESFGLVFLEAWACGKPVIGAAAGPVPELLADAGLTFRSGDAADLAVKIERLLADPELASRLARRGREKIRERHNWPQVRARVGRGYRLARGGLRVLVCSNLFPPHARGGAEVAAERQARALAAAGCKVAVFAGRLGGGPSGGRIEGLGAVSRVDLEEDDLLAVTPHAGARRAFGEALEHFRPDAVHFHNLQGLSARLVVDCRRRGIPAVVTLHDYWGICFKTRMIKNDGAVCRRSGVDCLGCREVLPWATPLPSPVRNAQVLADLRYADRLLAPSRYLADRFVDSGLPADRLEVRAVGIDVDAFSAREGPASGDGFTLGYVGQLAEHKGVDVLLRAVAGLGPGPAVRLVLVGSGSESERLRVLAESLGVVGQLELAGRVDSGRIAEVYRRFDAVVVPSVWPENSPLVIAEAMASGLPVIASDAGGCGELIDDGETGYLVPAGDVARLAERIERLRGDPRACRRMGALARERVGRSSLRAAASQLIELYEELADCDRVAAASPEILLFAGGPVWSLELRLLLYEVAAVEAFLGRRFWLCRADLAAEETLASARLMIVPAPGSSPVPAALAALRRGVPLLVTGAHDRLRRLSREANAGLEYVGAAELRQGLRRLLGDEALRRRLGEQGRRFMNDFDRSSPAIAPAVRGLRPRCGRAS